VEVKLSGSSSRKIIQRHPQNAS